MSVIQVSLLSLLILFASNSALYFLPFSLCSAHTIVNLFAIFFFRSDSRVSSPLLHFFMTRLGIRCILSICYPVVSLLHLHNFVVLAGYFVGPVRCWSTSSLQGSRDPRPRNHRRPSTYSGRQFCPRRAIRFRQHGSGTFFPS